MVSCLTVVDSLEIEYSCRCLFFVKTNNHICHVQITTHPSISVLDTPGFLCQAYKIWFKACFDS